ncbi:hypothetical protein V5E97_37920 [Singulisphaera sp. Ch08]|uniref:Uncharacterized protein n=1 Tax=Singulisphaera sp. Ch08 TaxID=3120278 RepID=A0AAU7CGH1_9BACT
MGTIQVASLSRSTVRDPVVLRFVDQVVEIMKLEVEQALGALKDPEAVPAKMGHLKVGATPREYPSVGLVIQERAKSLPPDRRSALMSRFRETAEATPRPLPRTDLKVNIRSEKYILHQIDAKSAFAFFNPAFAQKFLDSLNDARGDISFERPTAAGGAVINTGLAFRLHEVKCLDETDPERGGKDEIAMGGTTLDDTGNVTEIKAFSVGKFNDNDVSTFDTPKTLATFALKGEFPKTLSVFLALAEKDLGGFADFLEKLFEAIQAEVTVILTALGIAAGAIIGGSIGSTVGTAIGGPIGSIIGLAAGLILGALITFVAGVLKDDIFEPQIATVTLPDASATFAGSLISPVLSLVYADFDGKYRVKYSWEISR